MDNQEKLEKGVGDKEPTRLEAGKVQIVSARIEHVEKAKSDKVVFTIKHPSQDETIEISSAKVQLKDKLKTYGLWYKEDEDQNIQKGSTLAVLMNFLGVANLKDSAGKEAETIAEEDGYLVLRAYS